MVALGLGDMWCVWSVELGAEAVQRKDLGMLQSLSLLGLCLRGKKPQKAGKGQCPQQDARVAHCDPGCRGGHGGLLLGLRALGLMQTPRRGHGQERMRVRPLVIPFSYFGTGAGAQCTTTDLCPQPFLFCI